MLESWEFLGREEERGWRRYDNHKKHNLPLLFDISTDTAERHDIASRKPDVVAQMQSIIKQHQQSLI